MPSQKTVSCGGLQPFDGWKIEWSVRRFLHRCMRKRGEIGSDESESTVKNWGEDLTLNLTNTVSSKMLMMESVSSY